MNQDEQEYYPADFDELSDDELYILNAAIVQQICTRAGGMPAQALQFPLEPIQQGHLVTAINNLLALQRQDNKLREALAVEDSVWDEIQALDRWLVSVIEIVDYEASQPVPRIENLPVLDERIMSIASMLDTQLAKGGYVSLDHLAPQRVADIEKRRQGIKRAISPKGSKEYDGGEYLRNVAQESDAAWRDLHLGLLRAKKARDKVHANRPKHPYAMPSERRLMAELIRKAQDDYQCARPAAAEWVIRDLEKEEKQRKLSNDEGYVVSMLRRWKNKGSNKLSNELAELDKQYAKENAEDIPLE